MGFSAEWLSLREPADRAARDAALLQRAVMAAGPEPVILDLGCGTGSTVRAMAPYLPSSTQWRLVDNDPALLRAAADCAGGNAQTHLIDLGDLEALPLEDVTLVTASALLDLLPETWLRTLAARLDVPFYAALSYDGQMGWTPGDARDADVTRAFNAHQRSDKGLGAALGPDSVATSMAVFAEAGFETECADSPWRLGPEAAALQAELVEGIAEAAGEAGAESAKAWGAMRIAEAPRATCRIGHGDILAMPGKTGKETTHAIH